MNKETNKDIHQHRSTLTFVFIIANACLGSFNMGYTMSSMTLGIDTLFQAHHVTKDQYDSNIGLYFSIVEIGNLVGVISVKFLSHYFGRKHIFTIADSLGILSVLMIYPNRQIFLTFRFVIGLSNGINMCVLPYYIREISPQNLYQSLSQIFGLQVGLGMLVAYLIGIGFISQNLRFYKLQRFLRSPSSHYYQFVYAVPAIISLFREFVFVIIYPYETPLQHITKNKPTKANRVIQMLYKNKFHKKIFDEQEYTHVKTSKNQTKLLHIFYKQHRRRLLCSCLVAFFYVGSGGIAIQYYSGQLFNKLTNGDIVQTTILSIIVGVIKVISALVAIPLCQRLSRKIITGGGSLLLLIFFFTLSVLIYQTSNSQVVIIIFIYIMVLIQASTWAQIGWTLIGELVNPDGVYVSILVMQTFTVLTVYFFSMIIAAIQIQGVFLMFGILNLFGLIFVITLLRETKGLNPSQILSLYHKALQTPTIQTQITQV